MITRSDVLKLAAADPEHAVSIFMPTHVHGSETRQGRVLLKNLVGEARRQLLSAGVPAAKADDILTPALRLIDDVRFWQHRDHGLAVFLSPDVACHFSVAVPLTESVTVGSSFRITPLLPLLTADGGFHVLTVTEGRVRLYEASRFAMTEIEAPGLPAELGEDAVEPDYENPVQASPVARPHTGTVDISNAQVYGASPAEWRKTRLIASLRSLAAAVDQSLGGRRTPVVLVAPAEVAGHFAKFSRLGPSLAGTVDVNPESLGDEELHAAAYAHAEKRLDEDRRTAAEHVATMLGTRNPRAAGTVDLAATAAGQGRVDTLLLAEEETARDAGPLNEIATQTLRHGGSVHVLPYGRMPSATVVAAALRY